MYVHSNGESVFTYLLRGLVLEDADDEGRPVARLHQLPRPSLEPLRAGIRLCRKTPDTTPQHHKTLSFEVSCVHKNTFGRMNQRKTKGHITSMRRARAVGGAPGKGGVTYCNGKETRHNPSKITAADVLSIAHHQQKTPFTAAALTCCTYLSTLSLSCPIYPRRGMFVSTAVSPTPYVRAHPTPAPTHLWRRLDGLGGISLPERLDRFHNLARTGGGDPAQHNHPDTTTSQYPDGNRERCGGGVG